MKALRVKRVLTDEQGDSVLPAIAFVAPQQRGWRSILYAGRVSRADAPLHEWGFLVVTTTAFVWISFLVLVGVLVALDLGVFHRKAHAVSLPEAMGWTAVWISVALAFNVGVFYLYELNLGGWDLDTEQLSGREAALQFFTGYVVEKSLSVDNIFVIAMIFAFLKVPLAEQHRVLFWGI